MVPPSGASARPASAGPLRSVPPPRARSGVPAARTAGGSVRTSGVVKRSASSSKLDAALAAAHESSDGASLTPVQQAYIAYLKGEKVQLGRPSSPQQQMLVSAYGDDGSGGTDVAGSHAARMACSPRELRGASRVRDS